MRSPLYQAQLARGAQFGEVEGWELPLDYGDCLREYSAARQDCGVFDRSARGRLVVSGPDRYSWLQGMVSNDVRPLEKGDTPAICACVLSSTGHLLADIRIINLGDSLLLDMPYERKDRIKEILDQFIITENVELADDTLTMASLSIQGSGAQESRIRGHLDEAIYLIPAQHCCQGGFDLYVSSESAAEVWQDLVDAGIHPVGETVAETLRIEVGIPRFGVDMDEKTIPLECRLDSYISDQKGCYVGQEIIARIQSRGHTNRALTGLLVEHSHLPERGEKLYPTEGDDMREVGWVTSACHSPTLKQGIALAYIRHESRAPGTTLRTENAVAVTITGLPFVS